MRLSVNLYNAALAVAAVCLVKLAFFPAPGGGSGVIPRAEANVGIIEWKDAKRIVTAGQDGAVTYVWDYEGKTRVRKYYIEKNTLKMQSFVMDKEEE